MPVAVAQNIDLERLYAEIEARIERKFTTKIEELEKRCARLERDVERERKERDAWKNRYFKEKEKTRKLEGQLALKDQEIAQLKETVEKQAARIAYLEKEVYGRSTEVSKPVPQQDTVIPEKRGRGKQPGTKGYGRKKRPELETEECHHDFPGGNPACAKCGLAFAEFGDKRSEEITVEYVVKRIVHVRKVVQKTCKCPTTSRFKTAPAPAKLFKGSLYSIEFWFYVLYGKYHLQQPINRYQQFLGLHGLEMPHSAMIGGLKRMHERKLFKPLVDEILSRIRSKNLWQMDETHWKVFQDVEGKEGHQWWLWVTLCKDACLFTLDPSRSGEIPKRILSDLSGVLVSDRYSAYLNVGPNIQHAWCWVHVKRDFQGLLAGYPSLKPFAERWLGRIRQIFHENHLRLTANNDQEYDAHNKLLTEHLAAFERAVEVNLRSKKLHLEARKVLKSAKKFMPGLKLFQNLPAIPMDNNAAERAIRNAVTGRKIYHGSGSVWSADLAAQLFTIFATWEMNKIDVRATLLAYLEACAANGGVPPPNAAQFLPWNTPAPELIA